MAQVIKTTFKLRRGTAQRWIEVNPILAQGEPGFEYDTGKLKVGDGIKAWTELEYIGSQFNEAEIVCVDEFAELSAVGDANRLYKVANDRTLYQWNPQTSKYESLGGSSLDPNNISLINGGDANG